MKIILLERIAKLGRTGDVVSVRNGYARNYLLPRQKALRATTANIAYFEAKREEIEARYLKDRAHAEDISAALEGKTLTSIQQAGESGQLYGSVNAREIAKLLGIQGFSVSHNQISLDTPIKTLGLHSVRVELHGDVVATISINVARSEEDAASQFIAQREESRYRQSADTTAREDASTQERSKIEKIKENNETGATPSPSNSEEENRVA